MIKLKVSGRLACFTAPYSQPERHSYPVITPSAARGVLESIYWKPEFRWRIEKLWVFNPIEYISIRRNEINSGVPEKILKSPNSKYAVTNDRTQRMTTFLKDVCYGIEADIEVVRNDDEKNKDPYAKHLTIFEKRASRGSFWQRPYLGCRECLADYEQVLEFPTPSNHPSLSRDLGVILKDMEYVEDSKGKIIESNQGRRLSNKPVFAEAYLDQGQVKFKE